jgi:MFS family permease
LVLRIVYAFNWYNVGAVLPLIGAGFGIGTERLGIILGLFLVGVGIFQVPAGLASMRWGARRVSLVGVAVMGVAGILSAFSPSWEWLATFRFFSGVGAAFFFSPALSLIATYYPAGSRGPVIGLYNGGFSLGGALGLIGGAALGAAFGWQAALGVGGAVLLGLTIAAIRLLPRPAHAPKTLRVSEIVQGARTVLRSRSIWALSVSLVGFWAAIYVVAQYFTQYSSSATSLTNVAAATLAAVVIVASFPGGIVGGWWAERSRDPRRLIILGSVACGLFVVSIPFLPLWGLGPAFAALGFLDGVVFAVLYLIPTYLPEAKGESVALGLGIINSIQVSVGSLVAVGFGFLAAGPGYTTAWIFVGVLTLALLPLVLLVRPAGTANRSSSGESAAGAG